MLDGYFFVLVLVFISFLFLLFTEMMYANGCEHKVCTSFQFNALCGVFDAILAIRFLFIFISSAYIWFDEEKVICLQLEIVHQVVRLNISAMIARSQIRTLHA